MCGVRELDISCSAHNPTREQASDSRMAEQVTVASSTTPMERSEGLSSVPDNGKDLLYNKLLDEICEGKSGTEMITIPERIADVIFYKKECAFVGRESELAQADSEPEALCCDGVATS
jgi:hypothetical protein